MSAITAIIPQQGRRFAVTPTRPDQVLSLTRSQPVLIETHPFLVRPYISYSVTEWMKMRDKAPGRAA